jgi:hypothetical protein
MPPSALARLRARCLALPESYEKEAWGEPTFRVTKGKIFAMFASAATHHGKPAKGATAATSAAGQQRERGRNAVWLLATPENQRFMMEHDARRFFRPPYVGAYGWVGVYLDGVCDWTELPQLIEDAWRLAAPKSLLKRIASESAERP